MLTVHDNKLLYHYDAETVLIEAWGPNALRVRCIHQGDIFPANDWALTEKPAACKPTATVADDVAPQGQLQPDVGHVRNGKITASIVQGKLTIRNAAGVPILEEYVRNRHNPVDPNASALEIDARTLKPINGTSNFHLTARFESLAADERIYGMGQYQQPLLNLKGAEVELSQRNSQASVPFCVSSLGYGLLWNNPSVGRAMFGTNVMSFEARSTQVMDYWVVAGDTPAEIVEAYAAVTGKVPMMPEYGLGFWQCKLRYQTQDELLGVAREYRKRGLPLDLIVIDFFHWPCQGDWCFDPVYWPDPKAMVAELKSLKIELMVSIWPTVDKRSVNFDELRAAGHLCRTEAGGRTQMDYQGECCIADFTSPKARKAVWEIAKKNYFDLGIRVFWLDEAEPEWLGYAYDHYRYHSGAVLEVGNIFPSQYSQAFFEGQTAAGQKDVVNLVRCAWAGSQKYGALVWSGDIASSWGSFRNQLSAGLNMGLAGLPWWTTDVGGFHGGNPDDPNFRELLVRWFQWGAFCPVMRLHGVREPMQPQHGTTGGAACRSGANNEVWSYGEEVFGICKKYLALREHLREYTRSLMQDAHKRGSPVIRTLFYVFPTDDKCWRVEDGYMYGDKYLVAPILRPDERKREVYLPAGAEWQRLLFNGGKDEKLSLDKTKVKGGQTISVDAPLDDMPVFVRV